MNGKKSWWKSKIFYESLAATLSGVAGVVLDGLETPISFASGIVIAMGILTIIHRIWFTNQALT